MRMELHQISQAEHILTSDLRTVTVNDQCALGTPKGMLLLT